MEYDAFYGTPNPAVQESASFGDRTAASTSSTVNRRPSNPPLAPVLRQAPFGLPRLSPVLLTAEDDHAPLFQDVLLGSDSRMNVSTANNKSSTYRAAVRQTILSVGAALAFGLVLWAVKGRGPGMEFCAGYLVEQSLSVDNLFVFLMTFDYFAVPLQHQGRVLTWGIAGAVLMRGLMIGLGVAMVKKFRSIVLVFAGILLLSSVKLLTDGDDEHDLSNNTVVRVAKRLVGAVDQYDGDRFFTTTVTGRKVATPLLLCLVCIELSDFVFAVDSIPAVLGVSQDPLVVYSSNIFAILGLRSIYTLVARAVNQLPYLKPAVASVLGFVAIKMLLEFWHYHISTAVSLGVVLLLITMGVVASLIKRCLGLLRTGYKRKHSDSGAVQQYVAGLSNPQENEMPEFLV